MAKRITEFTSATSLAEGDLLALVDVSDTTQATSGTTKKSALSLIADYLKARVETLTNKTLTSPKINEDVEITTSSTEINLLDGLTASAAELNVLDGITASTAELNKTDGVTGSIVGTSDTQTLTNKTLSLPKINSTSELTANSTELNLLDNQTVLRKQIISGNSNADSIAAGETKYVGHGMIASAFASGFVFACAGTIRNLYVYTGDAPGVDQTYVCTLMKNNVAQSVTCTISGNGSNQASDTTNSFTVAAGDRVSLRIVASASATTTIAQFGIQFEPS